MRFFIVLSLVIVVACVAILAGSIGQALDAPHQSAAPTLDPLTQKERELALRERELELQLKEHEAQLQMEKGRLTLPFQAYIGYIIILAVVVVLFSIGMAAAYVIYRRGRVRHFERGPRGEMGYLMDGDDLVVPQLAATAITKMQKGQPFQSLSSQEAQAVRDWAGRAEVVRAAALASPTAAQNFLEFLMQGATRPAAIQGGQEVEVVDGDYREVSHWLDEVNQKLLTGGD